MSFKFAVQFKCPIFDKSVLEICTFNKIEEIKHQIFYINTGKVMQFLPAPPTKRCLLII